MQPREIHATPVGLLTLPTSTYLRSIGRVIHREACLATDERAVAAIWEYRDTDEDIRPVRRYECLGLFPLIRKTLHVFAGEGTASYGIMISCDPSPSPYRARACSSAVQVPGASLPCICARYRVLRLALSADDLLYQVSCLPLKPLSSLSR